MAFQEKIGTLTRISTTQVQLTGTSIIKFGGQQRVLQSPTLLTSVSGIGGIDTGAIAASSFYYVYAVYNGSATGIVASLSSNSPSGFTRFKKVGAFYTDTGSLIVNAFYLFQNIKEIVTKPMASNITVNTAGIASLAQTGLIIGKKYTVRLQTYGQLVNANFRTATLVAVHSGVNIIRNAMGSANTGNAVEYSMGGSIVIVATANSVTFNAAFTNPGVLFGNGTTDYCYSQIETDLQPDWT